jgi:sugar phosphate isomerase/epimerase
MLSKSYKGVYPFKLCTPSFIYPDHYVPNVKLLGPFVDEIELLQFESAVDSWLSGEEISALSNLSQELDLTYNIHLPTDISIGDPDPVKQQHAVNILIRVIGHVAPLLPTTYTLHVPYHDDLEDKDKISRWQNLVHQNLTKIIKRSGVGKQIAIETLDYPFEIIETIIYDLNLSICMDLGHLIVHGEDLKRVADKYLDKTSIVHLHGVENKKDHLALDRLPERMIEPVFSILKKFSGSVSLEVFSYQYLATSLAFLERCWATVKGG